MARQYLPATAISVSTVLYLSASLATLGLILLPLPVVVRYCLASYESRYFPIYPEGRPTSGSIQAPYFPAHLDTRDNTAQIVLAVTALIFGSIASSLLKLQWKWPSELPKPMQKIAAWVATVVAGGITALTSVVAIWLSFDGKRQGGDIDLLSIGYWPWQSMFPSIQWSIEGWTCKVHEQLSLPEGSQAADDFGSMCEFSRIGKWLALVLLFLGVIAAVLGCAAIAEQRCLDRGEKTDARADALRELEKSDKRLM